jgi:rare lipoprotein A
MRTGKDGRSRVELRDIDLRAGFCAYRWFWLFYAALVVAWLLSGHPARAETCIASQYGVGDGYHGKRAADGSIFNTYASKPYTLAHKTLPFGRFVTVTNLANGLSIRARVTDRGPFVRGRCVDLGRAGAVAIAMDGLAKVIVE